MARLVNDIVRIDRVLSGGKDGVKVCLSDVGLEAIDFFQCGIAVNRETVWAEPNELA